ncbi:hypothetical protein [Maricaulis sp.]|uniref:hypothetical protein n=1 Tax=Maricaulis sp. TaxID=1486257 RepID=UPI003A91326A
MPYLTRTACALTLASVLLLPGAAAAHPDMAAFDETAFATAPVTVDCTLENGDAATCSRITVNYLPEGLEIGPFCPATLDEVGGIWNWTGENGALYRIDAAFLQMLDSLGYRFFDDDGTVHVVDNATERPTVDHACINVSADESVTITMLLPLDPVMADQPAMLGVVGKVGAARAGEDGRNEPPRPMDGGPGGAPGGGGPGGLPPGFGDAAASLDITTQALMDALGDPRGGRPDLAAAAARLGITESQLRAALPPPPGR